MSDLFYSDQLYKLGELDEYILAEGTPDIRGWEVLSSDGDQLGHVDELIVDVERERVSYLLVEVDHSWLEKHASDAVTDTQKALVPIKRAEIHEESDYVTLSATMTPVLAALAHYDPENLTEEYLKKVHHHSSSDEHEHDSDVDLYDDKGFMSKRYKGTVPPERALITKKDLMK